LSDANKHIPSLQSSLCHNACGIRLTVVSFHDQRDACFDIRKSVEIVRRVNREILNILANNIIRIENTLHD